MRAFLIAALLTSVSVPAVAEIGDRGRPSRSEARAERGERMQRAERANRAERPPRQERNESPAPRRARGELGIVRGYGNDGPARVRVNVGGQARRGAPDSVRYWRGPAIRRGGSSAGTQDGTNWREVRENERRRITDADIVRDPADVRDRRISRVPVEGSEPPAPVVSSRRDRDSHRRWSGSDSHRRWRDSWRHDRRYDWSDWRRRNGSIFRLGFYFDPFGWNYRRYDIGYRMWPNYYGSRYWLNDPWQYRLPYAPNGYRWIRYWNDAILVDTWSGEVVDVIRNFFW